MANAAKTRQLIRGAVARHKGDRPAGRMRKSRWVAAGLATLLAIVGLFVWNAFSAAPQAVAELRSLVDEEVTRLARVSRNEIPYDAAGPDMGGWFQRLRDVPDGYRDAVRREMGRLFTARERAAVGSYFALPPAQRRAELDRRIKAEDARRQQWLADRQARGQTDRPGSPAAGAGPGGRATRSAAGQRGGGPPRADSNGSQRRGRPRSEDSRNEWMKRRIDASSPEERARRTEYRRVIRERREQLGLAPGRGGPARRPG